MSKHMGNQPRLRQQKLPGATDIIPSQCIDKQPSNTIQTTPHNGTIHKLKSKIVIKGQVKINLPWGGSIFESPPPSCTCTRILFNNVNGIQNHTSDKDFSSIMEMTHNLQIDILALAETNLAWRNPELRYKTLNTVKRFWKQARLITSSAATQYTTNYQRGGTAIALGGRLGSRTTPNQDNGLGRWSEANRQSAGRKAKRYRSYARTEYVKKMAARPATTRRTHSNGTCYESKAYGNRTQGSKY
jgi:hypothetical protein